MESIKNSYYRYLRYFLSKDDASATAYDKYMALAYAVRSELVDKWIRTQQYYHEHSIRRVYYLSMEYVIGKNLHQNIINAGLERNVENAARDVGFSLDELFEQEDDFELGNSGKGKLASLAITEPQAGSDLQGGITTRAEKSGTEWILNGSKMWCTNASIAEYIIIVARTALSVTMKPGAAVAPTTMSAPGSTTGIASMLTMRACAEEANRSARSLLRAAIVN